MTTKIAVYTFVLEIFYKMSKSQKLIKNFILYKVRLIFYTLSYHIISSKPFVKSIPFMLLSISFMLGKQLYRVP